MDDKLKQLSLNPSSNGTNSTVALNSTTSSLTASANATINSETTSINSSIVSPDSLGFTLVSENENTSKTISKKLGGVSKTETETLVVNGAGTFTNGSAEPNAVDSALVPAKPAGTDADAEDEDDDEDDSKCPFYFHVFPLLNFF